jgi:DNA ligase (NAD+)
MTTEELRAEVLRHSVLYYDKDAPEISDAEYDALRSELLRRAPDATELHYIGSPVARAKTAHVSFMGSLDKAHGMEDLPPAFLSSPLIVTPKLDGMPVDLRYLDGRLVRAVSRGDGEIGEDVTDTASACRGVLHRIARMGMVRVRGEAVIDRADFEAIRDDEELASARNAAAGSLRTLDVATPVRRKVRFMAYDMFVDDGSQAPDRYSAKLRELAAMGFDVVQGHGVHHWLDRDELGRVLMAIEDERKNGSGPLIDGAVLRVDDEALYASLGRNGIYPRGALAWKFEAQGYLAVVRSLEWNTGRTGTCVPTAILEPVRMDGCVVTRATLTSRSFAVDKGLSPGCTVTIRRANDIIPEILGVVASVNAPFAPPLECPSCQEPLSDKGAHLVCLNPKCPSRIEARTMHMLKTLKIKGIGERAIEAMFRIPMLGPKAPADVLGAPLSMFDMAGVGAKQAEKMWRAVSSPQPVSAAVAIAACGIPCLGRTLADRMLSSGISIDDLLACGEEMSEELRSRMLRIKGIGEERLDAIACGMAMDPHGLGILRSLRDRGLVLARAEGVLSGTSWLATGTLSVQRADFEAMVRSHGGTIGSSVSSALAGLVVGDEPGGKVDKAREKGVRMFTEAEFMEHLRELVEGRGSVVTDEADGQPLCHECGHAFSIDADGIATHDDDPDADRDHVPFSLEAELT